jgi:uncharacterized protein
MYTDNQKKQMLAIARSVIENTLSNGKSPKADTKNMDGFLLEKRGVFVTLTINGQLRGCIGNLEPFYPLHKGIADNAVSAAFRDPRFLPLNAEEFKEIKIEISVLTVPKKLEYKDSKDLQEKLVPRKDGVILGKGFHKATYLPQVWEELSDKEAFLCSLCMKAGLDPYDWKKGDLSVETYEAEAFEE